jgi:hypothetical protein
MIKLKQLIRETTLEAINNGNQDLKMGGKVSIDALQHRTADGVPPPEDVNDDKLNKMIKQAKKFISRLEGKGVKTNYHVEDKSKDRDSYVWFDLTYRNIVIPYLTIEEMKRLIMDIDYMDVEKNLNRFVKKV